MATLANFQTSGAGSYCSPYFQRALVNLLKRHFSCASVNQARSHAASKIRHGKGGTVMDQPHIFISEGKTFMKENALAPEPEERLCHNARPYSNLSFHNMLSPNSQDEPEPGVPN